jgi:hypothetical protein
VFPDATGAITAEIDAWSFSMDSRMYRHDNREQEQRPLSASSYGAVVPPRWGAATDRGAHDLAWSEFSGHLRACQLSGRGVVRLPFNRK